MFRISEQVKKNLASTQVQDLLEFFIENLDHRKTLVAMKAVLMGINSVHIIEHITPFIIESLAPPLKKSLGGKKVHKFRATDAHFETYFLLSELSDSLTQQLFSFKVLKRAIRLCLDSQSLFAVPPLPGLKLMAVTMYPPFPRSRLGGAESEQKGLQGLPKFSSIHFRVHKVRGRRFWWRQGVVLRDYFGSGETLDSFDQVRFP